ncbi:MAG: pantoate--beta-alanine ligase [Gammaproteobacteria bacterium RIFCSPHIGHO2_12_FULL_42_10]|nr:MAG: pantoate--beta-alanine ligase [Gammaproteobacteria bacterium RIFCSPHIGHO2_12_FULL_42_10]
MKIVTNLLEWQAIRQTFANKSVGLVHTMGNLHQGHLQLCERSKHENDVTVACIFINPTQFNTENDFKYYPRTLEQDRALLNAMQIDILIHPAVEMIYPDNYHIQISETSLSLELEGAYRPGHFNGMLTVVLKLLLLVRPTRAYYGEKDYQQLLLIKKMAAALFLLTEIIGCPTVRDHDQLALSSRNTRLSPTERALAAYFPKLLHSTLSLDEITQQLTDLGFKIDYITEKWQRRLGAVWINQVRLIDNIII